MSGIKTGGIKSATPLLQDRQISKSHDANQAVIIYKSVIFFKLKAVDELRRMFRSSV